MEAHPHYCKIFYMLIFYLFNLACISNDQVSPTFSSGKLKKMYSLIEQCVARLDKALEQLVRSGEELSIRKTMVNYTMDVIALCAFATKIDTHNTGTELHPFVKNSQVFFKPSPRFGIFFFLNATVPSLVKKFELSFVSIDVINYFKSTVSMTN